MAEGACRYGHWGRYAPRRALRQLDQGIIQIYPRLGHDNYSLTVVSPARDTRSGGDRFPKSYPLLVVVVTIP